MEEAALMRFLKGVERYLTCITNGVYLLSYNEMFT